MPAALSHDRSNSKHRHKARQKCQTCTFSGAQRSAAEQSGIANGVEAVPGAQASYEIWTLTCLIS
eukprot:6648438-Karenia_brevis.AAC.1